VHLNSQVCGLKWSHDDRELASGGNDNQLLVWNQRSQQPVLRLTQHTAAVKAIAWSPHQQGLLASGGGTADRCIRFWNTANGNALNSIDTGSQASFLYHDLYICCVCFFCYISSSAALLCSRFATLPGVRMSTSLSAPMVIPKTKSWSGSTHRCPRYSYQHLTSPQTSLTTKLRIFSFRYIQRPCKDCIIFVPVTYFLNHK
jgi:hypothetical protein